VCRHQPSLCDVVLGAPAAASRRQSDVPAPWPWRCRRCRENAVAVLLQQIALRRSRRLRLGYLGDDIHPHEYSEFIARRRKSRISVALFVPRLLLCAWV
jgi:hypothetical protein